MQKAEYRYYEISQDMPVLVLTGEKWETVYGMDNMHFHNYLEIGYCHYGKGTVQLAERELTYDAGTITFISRNIPHRTCPDPEKAVEKMFCRCTGEVYKIKKGSGTESFCAGSKK